MASDHSDWFAAIDLGSNSFHLLVVHHREGRLQVLDKHREMVRLAAGLDHQGNLSESSQRRALDCLSRFAERIRNIPRHNLRVVGTNALRRAHNSSDFVGRAEELLGRPVEIISGREEARLIFSGVSYAIENQLQRRLVVDIGGGSTELILGERVSARLAESLYMGCVTMSQRFFGDGSIGESAMKKARMAALQEMEPVEAVFRNFSWDGVVGASGTILAIRDVLLAQAWSQGEISRKGVDRLIQALIKAGHVDAIDLEGLSEERRSVFPGGVAILGSVMESLCLDSMQVSTGALREGVVIDMLGRYEHNDIRNESIKELASRFHVDKNHSERVKRTALALFDQIAHDLGEDVAVYRTLLGWAADVHEVGLDIAHAQYHKHGGYLLTHIDLPGFSQTEQFRVSLLVRSHRRKFPIEEFPVLADPDRRVMLRLASVLRLAVVLHRGRTDAPAAPVSLKIRDKGMELSFHTDWLTRHPLTRLDLEQEREFLSSTPVALEFREADSG